MLSVPEKRELRAVTDENDCILIAGFPGNKNFEIFSRRLEAVRLQSLVAVTTLRCVIFVPFL